MHRRYDCVLAVSSEDRIALQRLLPTAMIPVIPNGVDMRAFARTRPLPGGSTLIFVGTLDYRPNIDALTWFADEILPLIRSQQPQVTVQIVGRNAAPAVQALAEYEGIELVGEVDDVRPYLEAAAVYVLPMRIGGGVRLKLLEAFAMHVPVVSTSLGAEGVEGLQAGEQALIADNPSHFAAAVLQLLADRAAATRLSVAARSLAATYNWAVIAPRLANQYRELHSS
jgi:glycosyltransferase involved in cell wall biosynthesis